MPPLTLVLGGTRSGKSAYAEGLLTGHDGRIYIATGQAGDTEMTERIRKHRDRRGDAWTTVEEPLDLAGALRRTDGRPVLVDCLTLWLTNLLFSDADIDDAIRRLTDTLPALAGPVVFVSNEIGLGVVPDNALSRRFRDDAGRLNQAVAACCQRVVFVAAGLPLPLKDCR
ncbi:MAG: bifunctional adenosylcobinamide kinase/adenosylcobinamide-phosphate guanylyltransferase [Telmatospirillum sp.]|nr:bifunctional adenosylcobinamide kinase/adenosylcobinamide-phosphate guanylyltransferase [Telmatospirillum sp.]